MKNVHAYRSGHAGEMDIEVDPLVKVAINGLGRIGRATLKILLNSLEKEK